MQGLTTGDPYAKYPTLPAIGTLGGYIGSAQDRLRQLGESLIPSRDSGATEVRDSELAANLAELLRQSRLETALSQRAFDVFREVPYGGSFKDGGVIPGPTGAPRMILGHGGEVVVPNGARGGQIVVQLIVEEGAGVDMNKVRVVAEQAVHVVTREVSRNAARGLAGNGGGLG